MGLALQGASDNSVRDDVHADVQLGRDPADGSGVRTSPAVEGANRSNVRSPHVPDFDSDESAGPRPGYSATA